MHLWLSLKHLSCRLRHSSISTMSMLPQSQVSQFLSYNLLECRACLWDQVLQQWWECLDKHNITHSNMFTLEWWLGHLLEWGPLNSDSRWPQWWLGLTLRLTQRCHRFPILICFRHSKWQLQTLDLSKPWWIKCQTFRDNNLKLDQAFLKPCLRWETQCFSSSRGRKHLGNKWAVPKWTLILKWWISKASRWWRWLTTWEWQTPNKQRQWWWTWTKWWWIHKLRWLSSSISISSSNSSRLLPDKNNLSSSSRNDRYRESQVPPRTRWLL